MQTSWPTEQLTALLNTLGTHGPCYCGTRALHTIAPIAVEADTALHGFGQACCVADWQLRYVLLPSHSEDRVNAKPWQYFVAQVLETSACSICCDARIAGQAKGPGGCIEVDVIFSVEALRTDPDQALAGVTPRRDLWRKNMTYGERAQDTAVKLMSPLQ